MSWMDSWSRPTKHAVTPPPLYLTAGEDVPYCHSCGRLIGSRKSHSTKSKDIKYCSARCRNTKPGPVDRQIEAAFVSLLDGKIPDTITTNPEAEAVIAELKAKDKKKKKVKGEPRIIVECSDVEAVVFGHQNDPEKTFGRKKNRAPRGVQERPEDWRSVDMVDEPEMNRMAEGTDEGELTFSDASNADDDLMAGGVMLKAVEGFGAGKVRPPQEKSDVNGSVGGEKGWAEKIEETEEMKTKRLEGQRRATEKEMVKKAARRLCAFGFVVSGEPVANRKKGQHSEKEGAEKRQKCEAIMKGEAVEASYAKGEWGIRRRAQF